MRTRQTAKYLLRFDDICPTMRWQTWREIESILLERRLKPILAVIPDNQDPTLRCEPAAKNFWEHVRTWQDRGWTIALHGYQHRYVSSHAGILGLRKMSEFAGLPEKVQREKLQRGLAILRREGINPHVWIAPGHAFDDTTVSLLHEDGIRVICDGFFWLPCVSRKGMIWVPQQLFSFRPAPRGVWTVCYHPNQWAETRMTRFREEINCYERDICSLEDVLHLHGCRRSGWSERMFRFPRVMRWVIRCQLKLWSYRSRCIRPKSLPSPTPIKATLNAQ
jgi:predicted deacetylase